MSLNNDQVPGISLDCDIRPYIFVTGNLYFYVQHQSSLWCSGPEFVLIEHSLKRHMLCIGGKLQLHNCCDGHRAEEEVDAQDNDTKCNSLKENGSHRK